MFAIIAIMYAILYPVFQQNPHIDRRVGCQSNLKQIGLAYVQYEQDYDAALPPGVNAKGNGWAEQLYMYIKSSNVYRCPEDAHDNSFISYAENQNIARTRLYDFVDPPGTVALYEFTTLNCAPSKLETVSATGLNAPQNSPRHNSQTFALNFLLADGHVKHLSPGQVSGGANAVPPTRKGGYLATFAVK